MVGRDNVVGQAVAERIRELCIKEGITLNKLSIISGVNQSTLNSIISGVSKSPRVSTVKKVCDGLEITINELFDSPLFQNLDQEIK